jgi:hypothetical protein
LWLGRDEVGSKPAPFEKPNPKGCATRPGKEARQSVPWIRRGAASETVATDANESRNACYSFNQFAVVLLYFILQKIRDDLQEAALQDF